MAIELTGIVIRGERRVRLVFSAPLGVGAFGPAPAHYVIDNEDGAGISPTVNEAILVLGADTNVELALDADLATGALYRVRAIGVPAQDASTSTSASDQRFRPGIPAAVANVEPATTDAELFLYGRDLFWHGGDMVEDVTGDLATIAGATNAVNALDRRLRGAPLAWAPDYSPRAREFVDIPESAVGALRGRLEAQVRRDDRFKGAQAKLVIDEAESFFEVTPILVGGQATAPLNVNIVL